MMMNNVAFFDTPFSVVTGVVALLHESDEAMAYWISFRRGERVRRYWCLVYRSCLFLRSL